MLRVQSNTTSSWSGTTNDSGDLVKYIPIARIIEIMKTHLIKHNIYNK